MNAAAIIPPAGQNKPLLRKSVQGKGVADGVQTPVQEGSKRYKEEHTILHLEDVNSAFDLNIISLHASIDNCFICTKKFENRNIFVRS